MNLKPSRAILMLLATATAPISAEEARVPVKEVSKQSAFEQFKALEGEWTGKQLGKDGKDGHDLNVKYKVTSGGSTVVETIMPGTDHEMITVIHRDGDDLLLTHYCMLGNQPQMKASDKSEGNKFDFKFVLATDLKSDKDMHMHNVTYTLINKDTLKTEWTNYDEGKPAGQVVFELKLKR
jgi:hypothetical protein